MNTKMAPAPVRPDRAAAARGTRASLPSRGARHSRRQVSVTESWAVMPWSMRILRAFLGVTFVFAGAQKFLDGNFLSSASPDSIKAQLVGFSRGTPAGPLMAALSHYALLVGIGIALTEIAIGVGTLLGVGMMSAALGGALISLTLFLSATWHVHPYFLGSDSIYLVAWLALLAGLWEGDRQRNHGRVPTLAQRMDGLDRRAVIRGGTVAGFAIALGAVSKLFGGSATGVAAAEVRKSPKVAPSRSASTGAAPTQSTGAPAPAINGQVVTSMSRLPVGKAVPFTAAGIGPAYVFRLANDTVVAYSRVCTHAGCLVGYDTASHIIACPCHGAEFDPANNATPIAGPTSTPLQYINVKVDPATQKVYIPA